MKKVEQVQQEVAVRVIGEVQRLEVRPGDVLVVRTTERLSIAEIVHMRKELAREFPDCRVVLVNSPVELSVLSGAAGWAPAEVPAAPAEYETTAQAEPENTALR